MIPPLALCLSKIFWSLRHFCWKSEPITASSNWEKKQRFNLSHWKNELWFAISRKRFQKSVSPQAGGAQETTGAGLCHTSAAPCTLDTRLSAPIRRSSRHKAREHEWRERWKHYRISQTKCFLCQFTEQADADIWPVVVLSLWSCPPPAPSPSGEALAPSGWRSDPGSASGSSGSSSSWWTSPPPEDTQHVDKEVRVCRRQESRFGGKIIRIVWHTTGILFFLLGQICVKMLG